jgi:hypothetical protein
MGDGALQPLMRLAGKRCRLAFRAFEIAEDDGQQVVEIVGDPAGEMADGLHFLGLAQGVFGRFPAILLLMQMFGAFQDVDQ